MIKILRKYFRLFPAEAIYYFTRASIPRALDENILLTEAGKSGLKGKAYGNVRRSLQRWQSLQHLKKI